jgi:hypothetical protein
MSVLGLGVDHLPRNMRRARLQTAKILASSIPSVNNLPRI